VSSRAAKILLFWNFDAACVFGRTEKDKSTLYVGTSGGLSETIPGTFREGGKIVVVHVDELGIKTGN